jgi:hypothetical protein
MRSISFLVAILFAGLASAQSSVESYPRVMQSEDSAVSSPLQHATTTVGTTASDPMTVTGVPSAGTPIVWMLLQNRSAVGGTILCYTARRASEACAAAGAITCSGAATDGTVLLPQQSVAVKYDPRAVRICVVGSAAGSPYSSTAEVVR